MIHLSGTHLDAIVRHGEAGYPYEACGMLIGTTEPDAHKRVEHILELGNARGEDDRCSRFLISPADMVRGMRFAAERDLDVLGFYHSHPDHPALPSDYDLEHAWPFYSYVIVSISGGKAGDMTSWVLTGDDCPMFAFEPIIAGD